MHRNIAKSETSLSMIYNMQNFVKKDELMKVLIKYLEEIMENGKSERTKS